MRRRRARRQQQTRAEPPGEGGASRGTLANVSSLTRGTPTDPDGVLAALPGPAVEPAVERADLEPLVDEEAAPFRHRQPCERHLGISIGVSDAQDEGPCAFVPVGALPDARLAL